MKNDAFLRQRQGVALSGGFPPAQLSVEEAAEDVAPLGRVASDSLQEEVSAEEDMFSGMLTPPPPPLSISVCRSSATHLR